MATVPTLSVIEPGAPAAQRLPFNIEAEKALLGALLIENRMLEEVTLQLRDEHFYEPLHGRIFAQIRRLADLNMVANPITLRPLFETDPGISDVGGPNYLLRLTEDPSVMIAARDCAQQVYDLALLRALAMVGTDLVLAATDTSAEVAPMKQIEAAEEALYKVAESGEVAGGAVLFSQAAATSLKMAAQAMKSGGNIAGLTTGLRGLDAKLGGLKNSDLLIVAGRPGMGKTALATNIAFNVALQYVAERNTESRTGAPVAFFSLEMSSDQLATRILTERSGVESEKLRSGRLIQSEFNELARASQELYDLPFLIDDTPALSIAALRTRARRLKRQKSIGLIVVDYLQLLQGSSRSSADNRVNEISEISRGLKTLAKELQVPVIALSQLSRQVESREDRRPQLSDLRESGSIEQDADIVMFVYRDEYYKKASEPDQPSPENKESIEKYNKWKQEFAEVEGKAVVIIAKNRHGATGSAYLAFDGARTRFSDLVESDWAPQYDG